MTVTQYVGARYVPLFADEPWSSENVYEPLTIVLHEGNSFTSRQAVPAGIDINNTEFWAETGNYNAQVEAYRREVFTFDDRITANSSAIASETTARENAITAETTARENAITAETTARENAITAETTARENADTSLSNAINAEATTRADAISAEEAARIAADNAINNLMVKTVKDYGAKGDGVTDDTQAIQDCINNERVCIIPAGLYIITDTLTVDGEINNKCKEFIAMGDIRATLSDTSKAAIDFAGANLDVYIHKLESNGAAIWIAHNTSTKFLAQSKIRFNVIAGTWGGGLIFKHSGQDEDRFAMYNTFEGNEIWTDHGYGICANMTGTSFNTFFNSNYFYNMNVRAPENYAVYLKSPDFNGNYECCNENSFINVSPEISAMGFYLKFASHNTFENVRSYEFSADSLVFNFDGGCWYDTIKTNYIKLDNIRTHAGNLSEANLIHIIGNIDNRYESEMLMQECVIFNATNWFGGDVMSLQQPIQVDRHIYAKIQPIGALFDGTTHWGENGSRSGITDWSDLNTVFRVTQNDSTCKLSAGVYNPNGLNLLTFLGTGTHCKVQLINPSDNSVWREFYVNGGQQALIYDVNTEVF